MLEPISTVQNLYITNAHLITYKDDFLIIDILGGVDMNQVERMVCTMRITHANFPPYRTTIDLYKDNQIEKLQRILCDKWELKLIDVSRTLHNLTLQIEDYRLGELKFLGKSRMPKFELREEDKKKSIAFLKNINL